ncbi:MAG TPA: hypothetical protein VGQ03_08575 [Nitrososphaera sp.]|jgi:hypothetical protein|nr:hypothetical protein [Nitrososphaera sp.]
MNFTNKFGKNKSAIATMAALVAVIPAMFGGLISIGDVDLLSPDCSQESEQTQIGIWSKLLFQGSSQAQDCDTVDVDVL